MDSKLLQHKQVQVFMAAYATIAGGVGPRFGHFTADKAFIDRLLTMRRLCAEKQFAEIRVRPSGMAWGAYARCDAIGTSSPDLVVTPSAFWFEEEPQHVGYLIKTPAQNIPGFLWSINRAEGALYLGKSERELRDLVGRGDLAHA